MAGAGGGGREVGRVYVKVVPDTDGFRRNLQNELEAIEKSLKVTIPVEFDVDTAGLRTQLQALERSKITIPVDIGDGTEIERLRARIEALDHAQVTIPVEIGDGTEIERLRERVEALDNTRIQLRVSLRGATRAIRQLTELEAMVTKLDGRNVNIRIDVDGLGSALTQLATFSAIIKALPSGDDSGPVGGLNKSFLQMGTRAAGAAVQVGQLALSLLRVSAMATAIAIAGAAITAAWGGLSTLLAAIPAAVALIGVPLALILADTEELGKRIGDLSPAFQQLRKDIAGALAEGLAPALQTLANRVLPQVRENLMGIAKTLGEMAQETANWLATAQGAELLNGILANVNQTLNDMKPGLRDIGLGFMELANQAAAFDVLSGAINAFGESFRANLSSLMDGRLQAAFVGLRGVLSETARGFADLVHNGIRLFAEAAPGVERFLAKLREFFNRFDWERLGRAVGGVFDGLASALDKIPQATIDNITAAFERLSQTFQDPAIQQMFVNIISAAPMAINAINNMVQAFARAGSFLTGLANTIQGTISVIGTAIQAAGDPVGLLAGKYSQAFSEAQAQIALGATQIQQAFASLGEGVQGQIEPIPGQVGSVFGQIGPAIANSMSGLSAETAAALGVVPQAAEGAVAPTPDAVGSALGPVAGAVTQALGPTEQAAADALTRIQTTMQTGFAQVAPQIATHLQNALLTVTSSFSQISTIVTASMADLTSAINTGMQDASTAVTTGMQGITEAITSGTVNWAMAVTTGVTAMTAAVQTGFTGMAAAATTGMLGVETAILAGTAGWNAAIITGFTGINATMALQFAAMASIATTGMATVAAGITTGFATVTAAVTAGMALVVATVTTGMVQAAAAVTAGMALIQSAFVVNWAAITAAVTAATAQITAVLTASINQWVTLITAGWQRMVQLTTQALQQMVTAFQTGANQMVQVLQSAISRCLSILSSAGGQFRAAGANMGQALADGLNSKAGAVEAAARRLANAAAAAVRAAAAIRSPSRVFIELGDQMAAGLAVGLDDGRDEVAKAGGRLVDTLADVMGRAQQEFRLDGSDAWWGDFNARVNAELAKYDGPRGEAATGRQVTINTNIYNPVPESGSDSVAKTHRRQAAMGLFG